MLIGQIDQEIGRMHELVRTNIEACTKAYFGEMTISQEQFDENEFTISIMLMI